MSPDRAVSLINADPTHGVESLRVVGERIATTNSPAAAGDIVVDLEGARLLPGMINAHDHLQLNTLPALEPPKRYQRAHEWIIDVDTRRRTDRAFEARVSVPRNDRLLLGGFKNLLSGVTTVAHHDPPYPFLSDPAFPIRVVTSYGWSHSLYIDGEDHVRQSYRATPPENPWIIHAAEGTDCESRLEFDRLEALGCVQSNTLLVHGVALDSRQLARLNRAKAGLVWCPTSNLRLFGRTADVKGLLRSGRVVLGTDSRLSGGRDLLEELRIAGEYPGTTDRLLELMVTQRAAEMLHSNDRGTLAPGMLADLIVIPKDRTLSRCARADVQLVVIGGAPRYATAKFAGMLAAPAFWARIRVDGHARMLERNLFLALTRARCGEPGVDFVDLTWRAA